MVARGVRGEGMRYRRPKRQVADHALGYAVTHSDFVSTDRGLAERVARELDRVDPLPAPPCPHENQVELGGAWGGAGGLVAHVLRLRSSPLRHAKDTTCVTRSYGYPGASIKRHGQTETPDRDPG